MVFCIECGTECPKTFRFCPKCGTRIPAADVLTVPRVPVSEDPSMFAGRYKRGARIGEDDISEYYAARYALPEIPQMFVVRVLKDEAAQNREVEKGFSSAAKELVKQRTGSLELVDYGTLRSAGREGARRRPFMVFVVSSQANLLAALTVGVATNVPPLAQERYSLCARIGQDAISVYYTAFHGLRQALAMMDANAKPDLTSFFIVRILSEEAAQNAEVAKQFRDAALEVVDRADVSRADFDSIGSGRNYIVFRVGEQRLLPTLSVGLSTPTPRSLGHRYELGVCIGRDDVSEYYLARHQDPGLHSLRLVVRLLTEEAARNPEAEERFRAHALELCEIRHDKVTDFDSLDIDGESKRLYIVFKIDDSVTQLLGVLTEDT